MEFNVYVEQSFLNKNFIAIDNETISSEYRNTVVYPDGTKKIFFTDNSFCDYELVNEKFIIDDLQTVLSVEGEDMIVRDVDGVEYEIPEPHVRAKLDTSESILSLEEQNRIANGSTQMPIATSVPFDNFTEVDLTKPPKVIETQRYIEHEREFVQQNSVSPTIEFLKKAKTESIEVNFKLTIDIAKKGVIKTVLENYDDSEEDVKTYFLQILDMGSVVQQIQNQLYLKYLTQKENE